MVILGPCGGKVENVFSCEGCPLKMPVVANGDDENHLLRCDGSVEFMLEHGCPRLGDDLDLVRDFYPDHPAVDDEVFPESWDREEAPADDGALVGAM